MKPTDRPVFPERIISLDCESNGLHGQIFAAAASVQTLRSGEVAKFQYRIPIRGDVDPWVLENVIPALGSNTGIPVTNGTVDSRELYQWWREIYTPLKAAGYALVTHVMWPVESRFLWYAHLDGPFSGPFPVWDVAMMLAMAGHDPTSIDGYLSTRWPDGPPAGLPPLDRRHHPLHDARAAAAVFWDLTEGLRGRVDR